MLKLNKGSNDMKPAVKSAPVKESYIGQSKPQPMNQRNIVTSVSLRGRVKDKFSNSASKSGFGIKTKGGGK